MKKLYLVCLLIVSCAPVTEPTSNNSLPATFTGAFHWYNHGTNTLNDSSESRYPEPCIMTITEADSLFICSENRNGSILKNAFQGKKNGAQYDLIPFPGESAIYDGNNLAITIPNFRTGIDKIFKASR